MKTTKRRRKLSETQRTVLIVVAVIAAAALLVLVYGTETFTWEELFSIAGLKPGTVQILNPDHGGDSASDAQNTNPDSTDPGSQPVATPGQGEAVVTVLDVGQGDSILIETSGMAVLIDGGDYFAESALYSALTQRGIKRLDYVFITHPHRDHIGGLVKVLGSFEIGRLYMTTFNESLTPTGTTYLNLLQTISDRKIVTWSASVNDVIELDSGKLTVLAAGNYSDLNNCSLVIRYDYGSTSFLFMGDACFDVEDDLVAGKLPVNCDVLKAGHHGSRYATGTAFLKAAGAEYVVASCGKDNQYGYPTSEFAARVDKAGALLLRTDLDGDVQFVSDGERVQLVSETSREAA